MSYLLRQGYSTFFYTKMQTLFTFLTRHYIKKVLWLNITKYKK